MGKLLFWHHCLQLSFAYEPVSQISFSLFCSRDKKLLSEFVRKRGWFQGHNERFPNIFLSLENPYTFLLAKEKTWRHIFNTNSELLQNGPEKQIMPSKATNKLAISWYMMLSIHCLFWFKNWNFSTNFCKGLLYLKH